MSPTGWLKPPNPSWNWKIAVCPKEVNQIKQNKRGMNITTERNSLIVLPFDILAMNIPTKGDQEINQAQ